MLKRLQSVGQSAFLWLDARLNHLFGERLNPLYYLGAVSYWMLWIVVATGLYVYAFYRTGVDTTYVSVEAITHSPWYLGGIMRSVHRYASDAMVLTMLLHALRHFTFGAYRGFRAFSWITGAAVLVLVYASGVNGYMLPWDRTAQFVVTATAEWFDALPVFGGVLIRNFILPEAITDRFFSLLSFLHIGIPLALVALLWVHTQRVPRARTLPPRSLAVGSVVALIALALLKPAVSHGPAALGSVPTVIALDWFYLALYPIIYKWSPTALWTLLGSAAVLVVAAPWLPPQRRTAGARARVTVQPENRTIEARAGETLLDAALRNGIPVPFECRHGGCGVCKGVLLNGSVDHGVYQPEALTAAERSAGKLLLCSATAISDVEIEYERDESPTLVQMYTAHVHELQRLSHDVMHVRLKLDRGARIRFAAGQFVYILLNDGERRAYSLAAAPCETNTIDLHIRLIPGGRYTTHVFEQMKVGDRVQLEGPLGSIRISDSTRPLILVAGATGFAPVKSLLEHAFEAGYRRELILYWGVRQRRDLYMAELPERWQREHANFRYIPVLSAPAAEDAWTGRTGLVHEAILEDFPDLSGCDIYACGSVEMVRTARPAFMTHGLREDACFADAFVSPGQSAATQTQT